MAEESSGDELPFFKFGGIAKGVIAVGNVAYGYVAIGFSVAIGPIAIGMNALSPLVALGLNTVALLSVAGINAVGTVAYGGVNWIGGWGGGMLAHEGYPAVGLILGIISVIVGLLIPRAKRLPTETPPYALESVELPALDSGHASHGWVEGWLAGLDRGRLRIAIGTQTRLIAAESPVLSAAQAALADVRKVRGWCHLRGVEERSANEDGYRMAPQRTIKQHLDAPPMFLTNSSSSDVMVHQRFNRAKWMRNCVVVGAKVLAAVLLIGCNARHTQDNSPVVLGADAPFASTCEPAPPSGAGPVELHAIVRFGAGQATVQAVGPYVLFASNDLLFRATKTSLEQERRLWFLFVRSSSRRATAEVFASVESILDGGLSARRNPLVSI